MTTSLKVYRDGSWTDVSGRLAKLTHTVSSRDLEKLSLELVQASIDVGDRVRLEVGGSAVFEGVVNERRLRVSGTLTTEATAYSDLILYERYVVYRSYPAGTSAGEVVRDMAQLEMNVDVEGVEEGPSLKTSWEVQNTSALEVMLNTARGTNHLLRMKPGRKLIFKPKTGASPTISLSDEHVVSAEHVEDRWSLRNKIIYVGAGGKVLAEVSEPPADMPLVVHDPFLTDVDEAVRRAQTRLEMSREYGRQLRIKMHRADFEDLGVEAGMMASVSLSSLGLEEERLYVVETSYTPSENFCEVMLGGRLEYFEDYLQEALHGDTASLFGKSIQIPELITTIASSVQAALKIQADRRVLRLYNKPPLILENANNIVLNEDGHAQLSSGATSGWFETSCTPSNDLFNRWLRVHYSYEAGGGAVRADLYRADGSPIDQNIPEDYLFNYFPAHVGGLTEQNASEWGVEDGRLTDSENAVISRWSIRATKTATSPTMKIFYPADKNLAQTLTSYKYLTVYLYSLADDPNLRLRIMETQTKYSEAVLNHQGLAWRRHQIKIDTANKAGGGASTMNWLEVETTLPTLYIDSDYLLTPAARERVVLKISLTRPTPSHPSPKVKLVKIVWTEG
ncbi:MAG: hypothetical protein QXX49_07415 [Candidatus Caldarchaeum sp.]|uniref:Uncharacterized protein n=1 Tax=Caldiarchaeum subterraneum TaxID=311458 RepID=A0A7J3VUQ5_CALS0